jgi:hypothetical protein
MKKKLTRIMGVALATVMVLSLCVAFVPVNQAAAIEDDFLEWNKTSTPSKTDLVLLPCSDIYDFAVGGDDGSIVYAIGTIGCQEGSVNITDGEIWITRQDDDEASIHGEFELSDTVSDTDELEGGFSANLEVSFTVDAVDFAGDACIWGEIKDDAMTFCGHIHLDTGTAADAHFENITGDIDVVFDEDDARAEVSGDFDGDVVDDGTFDFTIEDGIFEKPALWRSTNGGETWSDKTDELQDATNLPAAFGELTHVAVAPDDADWLVVAGRGCWEGGPILVAASKDACAHFTYSGDTTDDAKGTHLVRVFDLAIAPEVSAVHNVALAGFACGYDPDPSCRGTVFRLEAGKWLAAAWTDTSFYDGWDEFVSDAPSMLATSVVFSPIFDSDATVVVMTIDDDDEFFLQSGIWEKTKAWNEDGGFEDAVRIEDTGKALEVCGEPYCECFPWCRGGKWESISGIALPSDYDGVTPSTRDVSVYVNAYNPVIEECGGFVFIIENDDVSWRCGPTGNPELASIAQYGTSESSKAMVGTLCEEGPNCDDVQVYRTSDLDVCCPKWYAATKPPTGTCYAQVAFTPDGEKAYATTIGNESAFSMSEDDGKTWNQLGLIDTVIDYLADVAVSPDCSTAYITSTNLDWEDGCDSVWRSTSSTIGKRWQRVYTRELLGDDEIGMIRLAPEEETGAVIYFGDKDTKKLYYSLDAGQNWTVTPLAKEYIQDFAVENESTVYVLSEDGKVSKSVSYGRHPTTAVDTKLGSGHSIEAMADGHVLVGASAEGKKVAYSDDSAASFSRTDYLPSDIGLVQVAFDPAFEENSLIYAAGTGGIFRWEWDVSSDWKDLEAKALWYTGLVLGKSDGTLYASYCDMEETVCVETGVARCLGPQVTACCAAEVWKYLVAGLDSGVCFSVEPDALRICGCLTDATDSTLYAVDWCGVNPGTEGNYDMAKGKASGTLWHYVDCVAKAGITQVGPEDGAEIACDDCFCYSPDINLAWERMCTACDYDIDISLGATATKRVVKVRGYSPVSGASPTYLVAAGTLDCSTKYYWRVRVEEAESGEVISSPWSDWWSFTIGAGPDAGVNLVTPGEGVTNIPLENIAFTWSPVGTATGYTFVLSANADLSSPIVPEKSLAVTAYTHAGPLDYSKPYYWQVKAMQDDKLISTSAVGTFTTMSKAIAPPEPLPPVVIPAAPAPTYITPAWIWAIIGIGAVLIIAVIILIVRTRRIT